MTKIFKYKNEKDEEQNQRTISLGVTLPTIVTVPLIIFVLWVLLKK